MIDLFATWNNVKITTFGSPFPGEMEWVEENVRVCLPTNSSLAKGSSKTQKGTRRDDTSSSLVAKQIWSLELPEISMEPPRARPLLENSCHSRGQIFFMIICAGFTRGDYHTRRRSGQPVCERNWLSEYLQASFAALP